MPLSYRIHGQSPQRLMILCHGFLGQGRNWHGIARKLAAARPGLGVVTPDLRLHGASQDLPGPHTLAACGADIVELAESLAPPVVALGGHSFGGKVALEAVKGLEEVRQVWVLDSTPSPIEEGTSAEGVLRLLKGVDTPMESRKAVVQLLKDRGLDDMTAQWVATNLKSSPKGVDWGLDLDALGGMLKDFYKADLWDVIESPPHDVVFHILKASKSNILKPADLERAQFASAASLHEIESGHWVNVGNPKALLETMLTYL